MSSTRAARNEPRRLHAEGFAALCGVAGLRHSAERHNIVKMMRLIEMPLPQPYGGMADEEGRTPSFFPGNLAGLSRSLESIESESLVVEDRGPQLHQTVTYRLKK